MSAFQKKLLIALATLLLFQTAIYFIKYFGEVSQGARFGGDFVVMSDTATALGNNDIKAIYDTAKLDAVFKTYRPEEVHTVVGPFLYPPHMLFLLWPLRHMSYNEAAARWTLVPLPFYFLLLYLLMKRAAPNVGITPFLIVSACSLPFLSANIFTGQTVTFYAVFFMAAMLFWHRKPWVTGVFLGFMTFKPQLGILLPFALLASKEWRIIVSAIITTAIFLATATLWFGVDIWADYLIMTGHFAEYLRNGVDQFDKLALGPYVSLHMLGLSAPIAFAVQIAVTVAVAGCIFAAFRQRDEKRQFLRFGLLACGGLLATPYAMSYDTPILAVAVAPFVLYAWEKGWRDGWELAALILILVTPFAQPLLLPYHIPLGMLSLLALFTVLWRRHQALV
jgi:alpha-1,2-mannosyltransferase